MGSNTSSKGLIMFEVAGTWYNSLYYFIECNTLYVREPDGARALKQIP